jgi:hypothetical protein
MASPGEARRLRAAQRSGIAVTPPRCPVLRDGHASVLLDAREKLAELGGVHVDLRARLKVCEDREDAAV